MCVYVCVCMGCSLALMPSDACHWQARIPQALIPLSPHATISAVLSQDRAASWLKLCVAGLCCLYRLSPGMAAVLGTVRPGTQPSRVEYDEEGGCVEAPLPPLLAL